MILSDVLVTCMNLAEWEYKILIKLCLCEKLWLYNGLCIVGFSNYFQDVVEGYLWSTTWLFIKDQGRGLSSSVPVWYFSFSLCDLEQYTIG